MTRRIKVAMLSDASLQNTGYATITKNLLNELTKRGFECIQFAHSYVGSDIQYTQFTDGTSCNFPIIGNGAQQFYQDVLEKRLQKYRPDVIIFLLDTFMTYPWLLQKNFAPAHSIFYYPHDGGGQLPQGCDAILRKVEKAVAMAKYGQDEAKRQGINASYIPHAVHHKLYVPYTKEQRQQLKARMGFKPTDFIVGTVARNQPRKMLDKTFTGFAQLAKINPDAKLLIHSDPFDYAQSFDMSALIQRLGIQNRVYFTGMTYYQGFEYTKMPEVYNTFDCFLLTTSGEGFGIPIIEAMSCGIPVVATNATTTPELVLHHKAGLGIDVAEWVVGSWNVDRAICSTNDVAKKLQIVYTEWKKDSKQYTQWCKNGRRAVEKYYTWDVVTDMWVKEIETLVGFKHTVPDSFYFANRNIEPKHFIDAKHWLEFLKKQGIEQPTAFEYGCGRGPRVLAMQTVGFHAVAGSEISQWAVDNTVYGTPVQHITQEDILKPKEKARADFVVAYDLLEHVEKKHLDKAIKTIYDTTNNYVLVSVPVIGDPNLYNDNTHKIFETKQWWKKQFTTHGFVVIDVPEHFLFKDQLILLQKKVKA